MNHRRYLALAVFVVSTQGIACAIGRGSPWKVAGGPKECIEMCKGWDLEFAGMVGVGDQTHATDGASACVCQVRKPAGTAPAATAEVLGAAAVAASTAAPISTSRAAAAAAEAGGP